MDKATVEKVEGLCTDVKMLCRQVREVMPPLGFVGPDPKVAELKRKSMDLTRALARLRGKGRF